MRCHPDDNKYNKNHGGKKHPDKNNLFDVNVNTINQREWTLITTCVLWTTFAKALQVNTKQNNSTLFTLMTIGKDLPYFDGRKDEQILNEYCSQIGDYLKKNMQES